VATPSNSNYHGNCDSIAPWQVVAWEKSEKVVWKYLYGNAELVHRSKDNLIRLSPNNISAVSLLLLVLLGFSL
jgi:hypothetical protein